MIKPYKYRRPPRKLAWLLDNETVLLENGRPGHLTRALARNVQVWATSEMLRQITLAGYGSAVLWRNLVIGWSPDREANNWPVRGLGMPTPDDAHEIVYGLKRWRSWLQAYGAAPQSSLGGTGLSLVKATLKEPLYTNAGDCPPIYYTMGGRQVTPADAPLHYKVPLTHSDIRAAYAQTLGGMRYGGWWGREKWTPRLQSYLEKRDDTPVYIRAKVEIPDLADTFPQLQEDDRGPLIRRPRKQPDLTKMLFWGIPELYPSGRTLQGVWTLQELQSAEAAGCRIRRVLDVWVMRTTFKPFAPWLEAVWDGRSMKGFSGQLAKATGNATWGQFAIAKGRRLIRTSTSKRLAPLRGGNPSQRAFDLAETICGRVRAKLYHGMLFAGPQLVTAHTDGLWSEGDPIPNWRHVADADEMRINNAQGYATRTKEGAWDYVVAGMLDAPTFFEFQWSDCLTRGCPTLGEWKAGRLTRARREAVKEIHPNEVLAISPETRYSPLMTHRLRERR